MSSDKPDHYRLHPKALNDLDEIWRYTAETWSVDQADRYIDELAQAFDALVTMPTMARERHEFTPAMRIHVHDSHLIAYTVESDHVAIVRILGGRQNWQAILNRLEP